MEQLSPRDKFPKAKFKEPDLRLLKPLLKPEADGDLTDDIYYTKIFEDGEQRAKDLAAGKKFVKRVYKIRDEELTKCFGKEYQGLSWINRASKATIGILSDAESNHFGYSYIELVDTVAEITTAEGRILNNPLKVYRVLGTSNSKLLKMEMTSGSWTQVEPDATPGDAEQEKIFRPPKNVNKAIKLIEATKTDLRERYPKAIIEDPNLGLPKQLQKPVSDPKDGLIHVCSFDEDPERAKHLGEAIDAGSKLARKVYRIRNSEFPKFAEKDLSGMLQIHRASKATIGMLTDAEANFHRHTYIDLLGTIEEVNFAEELILDPILKTYSDVAYPVILMPPTIHQGQIKIPASKIRRVTGTDKTNILRMEMESGAWIKIEDGNPPGSSKRREKIISAFGPREHVMKAFSLIQKAINEPTESEETKPKEVSGEPQEEDAKQAGSKPTEETKNQPEGGSDESEKGIDKESGEPGKGKQGEPEKEKEEEDVKEAYSNFAKIEDEKGDKSTEKSREMICRGLRRRKKKVNLWLKLNALYI